MRKIILFIFLLINCSVNSQNLSENKIRKLNNLNLKTEELNLNDFNIQKDLNKILILERKRKTNKTIGIVLSSLSLSGIIIGGVLVSKGSTVKNGHDFATPIGGMMIAGGVIYGGISIPFWTSSKKRKKERDKLIEMFDN